MRQVTEIAWFLIYFAILRPAGRCLAVESHRVREEPERNPATAFPRLGRVTCIGMRQRSALSRGIPIGTQLWERSISVRR